MYYFNVYLSLNAFFTFSIKAFREREREKKNNTHPVKLNVCYNYVVVCGGGFILLWPPQVSLWRF